MWAVIITAEHLLHTQDFPISHRLGGHQGVWRVDRVTKCLPEEPWEPRLSGTAGQMAFAGQLPAGSTASSPCCGRACLHSAATLCSVLPLPAWGTLPESHREGLSASHLKKQSSVGWSSHSPLSKGPLVLSRQVAIPGVQRNSPHLFHYSMLNGKCQEARLKKKKVLV